MINLHQEFQKLDITKEEKSYTGMDSFVHSIVGLAYKQLKFTNNFKKAAESIYLLSLSLSILSDKQLDGKLEYYRKKIRFKKAKKQDLYDALAYVSETSFRVLGIRPYSVQLMGVLAQQENFAIEMLPGEGKTVTAALSGIMAAWSGEPCHIVTSNDYLASRDAKEMQTLYNRCRLKSGCITSTMQEDERRKNYLSNVVYATSKELLADFLRDSMKDNINNFDSYLINKFTLKNAVSQKVMSGLHTAIIDEADSVLADEAITPLIISVSSNNEVLKNATIVARQISEELAVDDDYLINKSMKQVLFTKEGGEVITSSKNLFPSVWQEKSRREFLVQQALNAKYFYFNNVDYIINNEGEIVLVDEKTGRMMEGHSWGSGLQQAVEAKEFLEISDPTQTHMKMSFQRYFRLYKKISGMSGTLQNLRNELWHIYKLPTIKIPKRIANTYTLYDAEIHSTKEEKTQAIINNIITIHKTERPILVGTKDIKESEELAILLMEKNIECTVLNALKYEEEEEIVYLAGIKGTVTIATNMAGRGTDIKIDDEIDKLGGLHVIASQKFSSNRVDLQLYGRTARQGQNGTVQQIFSFEDELFERFSNNSIMKILMKYSENKLSKKAFMALYKIIQLLMERKATHIRKKILQKDFSTNEMLSFSSNDK
ncbi:MAG: preprotein translocase subunit SecA [Sulfurimonas sp.]|jgi:preprotein translocase subunit SecA|uniref:preprotein translocase subunit SecA n=1 Tax=Sulfurimonas sp. TaxID=2022749 RepID=UPI0039E36F86